MRTDFFAALLGAVIVCSTSALAQLETIFVYQGSLMEAGEPASGEYEFQLRLLDDLNFQISTTQFSSAVINEGIFQIDMDFGPGAFDGSTRYLEVSVRPFMDAGPYTLLSPSQLITSTPFAQFALSGNEGPQGDQGEQGNTGPIGMTGTDGNDGATGSEGPQGVQGLQGIQGDPGSDGAQGIPGDSHWALSGAATYYAAGNVGIGTSSPISPLHVETSSVSGRAIYGLATANAGLAYGGRFESHSSSGRGVYGQSTATAGTSYGVYGENSSTSGRGVFGVSTATTGTTYGVRGETNSPDGYAGYFEGGRNYFEGNVGIGTNSPISKLHINSSLSASPITVQKNGSTFIRVHDNGCIALGGGGAELGSGNVHIRNRLGINTNTASFDLTLSGTAGKTGGGSWAVFSDKRLKKNITSMTGSLDTISALRPVNFEYTAKDHFSYSPGVQSGFIAQEVQQVMPQWVNTADDGYFYLDQVGYEALIVDAIQELRTEKDAVQEEVNGLRLENELLKARLDRLERVMVLIVDK